jgi:hypothetical protein
VAVPEMSVSGFLAEATKIDPAKIA